MTAPAPIWQTSAFTWHKPEISISELGYSQQEILALAYLRNVRNQVVDRGFSFLASFDGRHRSGKSTCASAIGVLWDETFWKYYESRMVNEPKEFVDAVESIAKNNISGAVIQIDEAGIALSSGDWYERWMKTITKMVQMFGYLHPIVLFCAPVKDFVQASVRKMFHSYYKIDRYTNDYVYITPYNLKYNTVYSKWFYKKPIIKIAGQKIALRRIKFGKPPQELCDRYDAIAIHNKEAMLAKFVNDMKKDEIKDAKKAPDIDQVVASVASNFTLFETKRSSPDNPMLDSTRIEFTFHVPNRMSRYIKNEAERILREKYRAMHEQIAEQKEKEEAK